MNAPQISSGSVPQIPTFKEPIPDLKSLDGICIAIFFAIFPHLQEGTSFGIVGNEVIHQGPFYVNILGYRKKAQWLVRTMNGDSRAELIDICYALQRSIKWYRNNVEFIQILKEAIHGLSLYQKKKNYQKDAVLDTLQQAIDKIEDIVNLHEFKKEGNRDSHPAVIWLGQPMTDLNENEKNIYTSWSSKEIATLWTHIQLIKEPKSKESSLAAILSFLATKQKELASVLQAEEKQHK